MHSQLLQLPVVHSAYDSDILVTRIQKPRHSLLRFSAFFLLPRRFLAYRLDSPLTPNIYLVVYPAYCTATQRPEERQSTVIAFEGFPGISFANRPGLDQVCGSAALAEAFTPTFIRPSARQGLGFCQPICASKRSE